MSLHESKRKNFHKSILLIPRLIVGAIFVVATCLPGPVLADKLDDFKAAAGRSKCQAIPYSSDRRDCENASTAKGIACTEIGCSKNDVEKLLEKYKEKKQNLLDAKNRKNDAAIPDLEKAVQKLDDALKEVKSRAKNTLVARCKECIAAREKVQTIFATVKSKVQGESDKALSPYVNVLVAHFEEGAREHIHPLNEVKTALTNCQFVADISW